MKNTYFSLKHNLKRPLISILIGALFCILAPMESLAVNVNIRLVDQNGLDIPSGKIIIGNLGEFKTPLDANIAEGIYSAIILPLGEGVLYRTETLSVTPSGNTFAYEWIVQDVTVRLTDQFGVNIPAGRFESYSANGFVNAANGGIIRLPITDEGEYPSMGGINKNGYPLILNPIGGNRSLIRTENLEVTAGVTAAAYEWIVQDVQVRLTDQNGINIPAGLIGSASANGNKTVSNGGVLRLPLTDESVYPTMDGWIKNGFELGLNPIGGDASLIRRVILDVTPDVTAATYEWIVQDVQVRLTDQDGINISGAQIGSASANGNKTVSNGGVLRLPITDESVYPTMDGWIKNGFSIGLNPAVVYGGLEKTDKLEVTSVTASASFEWICSKGPITVIDRDYKEIPNSTVRIGNWNIVSTGTNISIPITDESIYPTLIGMYKTGFPTAIKNGITGVTKIDTLEFLQGNYILPEFTDFDGTQVGLMFDSFPPVTEIVIGDPLYSAEMDYTTAATLFSLNASDRGRGVAVTEYRLDTGSWTGYTAPFAIGNEGLHQIVFRSADKAGNMETAKFRGIIIDTTAPSTEIRVNMNNTVELTAEDPVLPDGIHGSGVKKTEYRIDTGAWTAYDAPFTVTGDGSHTVYCRSADNLDNTEEGKSRTIDIIPDTVDAVINIDPNTLNLTSMGRWVMVYIEIPGLSHLIIPSSVTVEQIPVSVHNDAVDLGDYDSNGIDDVMLIVDRQLIEGVLTAGDNVAITVHGNLETGAVFTGTDRIKVIDKGRKPQK